MSDANGVEIDVLVVCQHDAEMVQRCLTSAREGARHQVNLWVWQNGGGDDGSAMDAMFAACFGHDRFQRVCSAKNEGFIRPNNRLAALGTSPYICLLNADTISAPGWDVPLVEALQTYEEIQMPDRLVGTRLVSPPAIVGYGGALLGRDMVGMMQGQGYAIDYIEGWCLMTTRAVWDALGGFDEEHLTLAYGEDSDLCLRAKEAGYGVCAVANARDMSRYQQVEGDTAAPWHTFQSEYVHHLGGKGATEGTRRSPELQQAFAANHAYLRERHKRYLESERVLVKGYKPPATDLQGRDIDDCLRRYPQQVSMGEFIAYYEVDGRLWQLDFAGMQPVRFLVP